MKAVAFDRVHPASVESGVPDVLHTGMQVDARDRAGSLRGQPLYSTRRGGRDL
jgi:hypothetical protein